MKKKLFSLLIGLFAVILMTGCGAKKIDKEEITLKDDTLKYKTTFKYEKEDGFEFVQDIDGGRYKEIEFKNTSENLYFDMYYTEQKTETYEETKKNRKTNKYYKEYKYGKYDAYVYSDYSDNLYLDIKLSEDSKTKSVKTIYVAIETITYDNSDVVFDMFNRKVTQDFFNSIELTVE